MPVLVSVLQMLTLVVGKVEPPYRRPAHVAWSARGQAGSRKKIGTHSPLAVFLHDWTKVAKCLLLLSSSALWDRDRKMQEDGNCCTTTPEADRREGDQAGNFRKSKQRGRGGYGNEWRVDYDRHHIMVQVPFGRITLQSHLCANHTAVMNSTTNRFP
jgi:hypothetical protein